MGHDLAPRARVAHQRRQRVRVPRGAGRWRGVVLVAVRAAAAPGLPVDRDRARHRDARGGRRAHTRRIVGTTSLFIAGFGTVYVLLGLTAASIGQPLRDHQVALTRVSGAIMLAMALFLIGSMFLRAPWLYQEKRFHPQLGRYGAAAPVVAGVAFGSAGRRASDRSSVRSSASRDRSSASGPAPRCSPSTRSVSAFRSSSRDLPWTVRPARSVG